MLKIWEDEFIFSYIMDSMIYFNANEYKCKSYTTDLNNGNIENNLNTTIVSISIKKDYIKLI